MNLYHQVFGPRPGEPVDMAALQYDLARKFGQVVNMSPIDEGSAYIVTTAGQILGFADLVSGRAYIAVEVEEDPADSADPPIDDRHTEGPRED
jgi:hypothetical protein